jgi:hypothetical protein
LKVFKKENGVKKGFKKLVLHRETLRELDGLSGVVGGAATQTCQPDYCDFSNGRNTCTTCIATCTTNYC